MIKCEIGSFVSCLQYDEEEGKDVECWLYVLCRDLHKGEVIAKIFDTYDEAVTYAFKLAENKYEKAPG